jgi:hypothetical protein
MGLGIGAFLACLLLASVPGRGFGQQCKFEDNANYKVSSKRYHSPVNSHHEGKKASCSKSIGRKVTVGFLPRRSLGTFADVALNMVVCYPNSVACPCMRVSGLNACEQLMPFSYDHGQGVLTKAGDQNFQPDALSCCNSCRNLGEDNCNVWVWCGEGAGCDNGFGKIFPYKVLYPSVT